MDGPGIAGKLKIEEEEVRKSGSGMNWGVGALVAAMMALTAGLIVQAAAPAQNAAPPAGVTLLQLSSDPFTNTSSQHATQVEPDTYSYGRTIVMTFQSGRFTDGGSSDVGWATSTDGGKTWTNGFLPGITVYEGNGPYQRDTDPAVAYDAAHSVWIISSLTLNGPETGVAVVASRSTDGGLTWQNPVTTAKGSGAVSLDKNWIVCDTTAASPYYGHCYVEFDEPSSSNTLQMYTSTDGGMTWTAAKVPSTTVIGGQPLVQPNGTVIMPIDNAFEGGVEAVNSTDGGMTYSAPVQIATINDHAVAGDMRAGPLPSAQIDGAGTVYVAWQDCRFRANCASNDIVYSTSTNGTIWSTVQRVPIDLTTSAVDHFIPGIAVDKATSGASAHVGVAYYYYPVSNCTITSCALYAGYISSRNGGVTWGKAVQLTTAAMNVTWLANTDEGYMVGDYIATAFIGSRAFPVFAYATAPVSGVFSEATYTVSGGLPVVSRGDVYTSKNDVADPNAKSDHPPHQVPNLEPPARKTAVQ
jgi:hypothetical protein